MAKTLARQNLEREIKTETYMYTQLHVFSYYQHCVIQGLYSHFVCKLQYCTLTNYVAKCKFTIGKVKMKTMLISGQYVGVTFELSAGCGGGGGGGHLMVCFAFACLLACEKGHFACLYVIFKLFSFCPPLGKYWGLCR